MFCQYAARCARFDACVLCLRFQQNAELSLNDGKQRQQSQNGQRHRQIQFGHHCQIEREEQDRPNNLIGRVRAQIGNLVNVVLDQCELFASCRLLMIIGRVLNHLLEESHAQIANAELEY